MSPILSSEQRNLASHFQDGHPNVLPLTTYAKNGLAVRGVFVATCHISRGHLVLFDYGKLHHHVKLDSCYIQLDKSATIDMLRRRGVKQLVQDNRTFPITTAALSKINDMLGLQYLANTPHVIFSLLCDGLISYQEIVAIKNHAMFADSYLCVNWSVVEMAIRPFTEAPSPRLNSFKSHLKASLDIETAHTCMQLCCAYYTGFATVFEPNQTIPGIAWFFSCMQFKMMLANTNHPA